MLQELRRVTRAMARATLAQLRTGYSSRSGSVVAAMEENELGCFLGAKKPNRSVSHHPCGALDHDHLLTGSTALQDNGYIQITPVGFPAVYRTTGKTFAQLAHRLAVIAEKTDEDIAHLLDDGYHASHLCHEPRCFRADHIIVETKADNEDRKQCKGRLVMKARVDGVLYTFPPKPCPHQPECLAHREQHVRVPEAGSDV